VYLGWIGFSFMIIVGVSSAFFTGFFSASSSVSYFSSISYFSSVTYFSTGYYYYVGFFCGYFFSVFFDSFVVRVSVYPRIAALA